MMEASEAIGQVKFELLAHQNGHVAELDIKQGTTGQILGAEARRERQGKVGRTYSAQQG